jgi:nucleotide-binding universal stress UspA family protein
MRFSLKSFENAEFWEVKATSVAEGLHDFFAHRCNADLLVIGSRGVSGVRRILTGSVSTAAIDAVDVPVLVVRASAFVQDAPPFKLPTKTGQELTEPLAHPSRSRQVALAVDGSDISSVLVTWAIRTFLRRDDYVTLLHSPYGLDEFDTLRTQAKVASCVGDIQKLCGAKDHVQSVRLEEHVEPREALLQAVDKRGPFDVLVIGSRGGGTRLRERLTGLGSVSSRLIQFASCPVLVLSRKSLVEWLDKLVLTPETPAKSSIGQGVAAEATAAGQ